MNFQNKRSSGDKNFWFDLVPLLALKLKEITILSIRECELGKEEYRVNDCKVTIKYLSPVFLEVPDSSKIKVFWREDKFPDLLGRVEKILILKKILYELAFLAKESLYQHIHLTDNFGFANRLIVKSSRVPVTVSAMSYHDKRPAFA